MGFVFDPIIGRLTDAASAVGTVMARLKYLIDSNYQKALATSSVVAYSTSSATYQTAYTYTGQVSLKMLRLKKSAANTGLCRITIDGTTQYVIPVPAVTTFQYMTPHSLMTLVTSGTLSESSGNLDIKCKTSLLVELLSDSGVGVSYVELVTDK